ncbi:hypothetical protein [Sinomonas soli]
MSARKSQATLLKEAAEQLTGKGFLIHAVGKDKVPAHPAGYMATPEAVRQTSEIALGRVSAGKTTGIAVFTGSQGFYTTDGANQGFILTAFEMEGRAMTDSGFYAEWELTVERRDLQDAWKRLEEGWKEKTPSGGLRWFFAVEAPDADYAQEMKGLSGSLAARRDSRVYAELLVTHASVIVAPSHGAVHPTGLPYERLAGGPDTLPRLSFGELNAISELLAELDEAVALPGSGAGTDLLDGRSKAMLRQYDRKVDDADLARMIGEADWTLHGQDTDGTWRLSKEDGHAEVLVGGPRHEGAAWTFSTSAAPLWVQRHMRPADVLAALTYNGDYAAMLQDLQESGEVRYEPWPLTIRKRATVYPDRTVTHALAKAIGSALQDAEHPTITGVPFALLQVHPRSGKAVTPVSIGTDHELRRWSGPCAREILLLSVVQPARRVQQAVTYQHALPSAVVDMVLPHDAIPAALPTVRYVAGEPILLPDGSTISVPGHHRQQEALLAIPHRERAYWAAYTVPAKPTQAEAQAAADFAVSEVLTDFPFETSGDLIRALAYLLTGAARDLTGATPGWLLDAAERGSGKSLLARIMRLICTGDEGYTAVGYSRSTDVETGKEIVAAALTGARHLHVDELPRQEKVTSKVLMELITDDGTARRRVLGSSTEVTIPPMTVTVCGNNAELGGDSNRRFIPIRMVNHGAVLAFERTGFRHDNIVAWVRENRPRLLAALHTVLAYGLQHPVPLSKLPTGFGSFERWMTVVGSALHHIVWEGRPASELFAEGRREFLQSQDDEGDDWGPLMAAWHARFGNDGWVTAKTAHTHWGKGRGGVDLPAALLNVEGISETGLVRAWGHALSSRRESSIVWDGHIYRLAMKRNDKRGHAFAVQLITAGSAAQSPAPLHTAAPPIREKATAPQVVAHPAASGQDTEPLEDLIDLDAA